MMFSKDLQLFYRQWQDQLEQGVAHWQTMMQTQAHALEALVSAWQQGLDEMFAGWAGVARLGGDLSPLSQPWTQAVVQWYEGYAQVASTVLTGDAMTTSRQMAMLTQHVTGLADLMAHMDRRLESLSDHQARMAPDAAHLLQRLQSMQEAFEQRLHALTERLQETLVTHSTAPSRATTRRKPPST
jgi:hypothetical protein